MRLTIWSVSLMIVAMYHGSLVAGAGVYDLWVKSISLETTPAVSEFSRTDATQVDVAVEVIVHANSPLPDGTTLSIEHIQNDITVDTKNFSITGSPQVFSWTVDILVGDQIRASVDPGGIVAELNENNNSLLWEAQLLVCGDFRPVVDVEHPDDSDEELTLLCNTGINTARRTYYWPVSLLILPPYNQNPPAGTHGAPPCPNPADPQAGVSMVTSLTVASSSGSEVAQSAGVTAGAAIEAEFGWGPVAKVTVGAQIAQSIETSFGQGWERSRSETFSAETTSDVGFIEGDHIVVLTQTEYLVAEYTVTDGEPYVGEKVWVTVPVNNSGGDSPALTAYRLQHYPLLKHPDAPTLSGHHRVGDLDTYSHTPFDYDVDRHIEMDSREFIRPLATERQQVGTAEARWCSSITESNTSETTVAVEVNAFARGEVGGVSREVSFGTFEGFSHRIYQTVSAEYCSTVGGVCDPILHQYDLTGWAANVRFVHEPQIVFGSRTDALLVLCYWVDEPPLESGSIPVPALGIWGVVILWSAVAFASTYLIFRRFG